MPIVGTRANGSAGALGFGAKKGKLPYLWVAGGFNGGLSTGSSTTFADGTWTSRTSSFGTDPIYGVASNGTSLYVAVGDNGKLATSPDAITWTQRTSSFGTSTIKHVAYGGGYWVAVGQTAKVAYSTDGINWTQKTTGIGSGFVNRVAWGNGLWVIGNSNGELWTATDPTGTWTSRTSTLTQISFIHYAPSQSVWVACGDTGTTGALASSSDGLTWTARNSTFNISSGTGLFASNSSVIAHYGSDGSLSVDIQTSTNGTSWTNRTPGTTSDLIYGPNCASDDSGLLVLNAQTSTNGTSWTTKNGPPDFICLCHSSGTPSIR